MYHILHCIALCLLYRIIIIIYIYIYIWCARHQANNTIAPSIVHTVPYNRYIIIGMTIISLVLAYDGGRYGVFS